MSNQTKLWIGLVCVNCILLTCLGGFVAPIVSYIIVAMLICGISFARRTETHYRSHRCVLDCVDS